MSGPVYDPESPLHRVALPTELSDKGAGFTYMTTGHTNCERFHRFFKCKCRNIIFLLRADHVVATIVRSVLRQENESIFEYTL